MRGEQSAGRLNRPLPRIVTAEMRQDDFCAAVMGEKALQTVCIVGNDTRIRRDGTRRWGGDSEKIHMCNDNRLTRHRGYRS